MFGKNIWSPEVQRGTKSNRNPGKKQLINKTKLKESKYVLEMYLQFWESLERNIKELLGYFPAPPGPSAVPLWKQLLVKIDHEDKICCAAALLLGQPN